MFDRLDDAWRSFYTKRPGLVRVIVAGIDGNYLQRRLDDFERFVLHVAEKGAVSIYWA